MDEHITQMDAINTTAALQRVARVRVQDDAVHEGADAAARRRW